MLLRDRGEAPRTACLLHGCVRWASPAARVVLLGFPRRRFRLSWSLLAFYERCNLKHFQLVLENKGRRGFPRKALHKRLGCESGSAGGAARARRSAWQQRQQSCGSAGTDSTAPLYGRRKRRLQVHGPACKADRTHPTSLLDVHVGLHRVVRGSLTEFCTSKSYVVISALKT